MPTPILMRPTSVTGLILSSGAVGTDDATGTQNFYIKVVTAELDHRTKIADVSGDGDASPHSAINYWGYVDWMIRGYGIAAQAIAYDSMINPATSPTTNPTASGTNVVFNVSSGISYAGRFFISQFKVSFDRTSAYVGITMLMRKTALLNGTDSYVETP